MFDLTYVGHAGWLIKNKNFRILCDPWFNPEGAFFSAWFPFPDNLHLLDDDLLKDLDFIYISHSHQDHCDPWVLNQVDKSTTILIPKFKDRLLFNKIKALGFSNIQELPEDQDLHVKNIKIKVVIDDKMIEKDSGLLLDDGTDKILNLNDCHSNYKKIKKLIGKVDLLLVQSSSAIWWPCVYEYDNETMETLGRLKRKNSMKRALEYYRQLEPGFIVPNAGPPVFLHGKARSWDETRREESNPFILNDEVHKFFLENEASSLFVIPGSRLLLDNHFVEEIIDYDKREEIYNNITSYLDNYRKRRQKHFMNLKATSDEKNRVVEVFGQHIMDIKKHSKIFAKKINFPFLVDFKEYGKWIVDFEKDIEECFSEYKGEYYNYNFKFDPDLVAILFRGKSVDFEDYFLSMRFSCNREVDQFNEYLFGIFKNFDLKRLCVAEYIFMNSTIPEVDKDETFELICNNGNKLNVKRYCPHRQVDLKECGYINEKNELVCPLHGWKFSLEEHSQ